MKNVCILFFLILCNVVNAQIINFPDANFKNALVNTKCVDTNGDGTPDADADLNNDGEIDVSEAKIIDNLNVEQANIANLEGINHFISLTDLRCGFNRLESLNVQGLTNLKYIFCNVNILTSLNVQGLANLFQLDCSSNQLTTLNVEGLTNLKLLDCTTNQLKVLNVNGLSNLGYLYCNQNNLTSLNVEGVINMVDLRCQNNQLSSLSAKNLKNLLTIFCGENILKSLDIDGSKNLTFLSCKNNKFSSLDLHEFINLELLDCRSNQLKSLILKNTILEAQYLFFADNENLNYICCNENIVSEIKNLAIFNGPNKCEVNSYCTFTPGSKFYILKGKHTYKNINNGCEKIKWPNLTYQLKQNNNLIGLYVASSTTNYSIPLEAGTYTITPAVENPNHYEVAPSSISVTFPTNRDTITQDFCIAPKGIFRQTNITVIPLTPPARPGFNAKYKIIWENVGNLIESGTLNFTYDEALLDYISATKTADQISDGIVKWNFSNLLPFEKREITVTLKVNRPTDTPAVNAGVKLYMTASILDNIFTLENTVVGSYDPNDKTCLQGDRVHPDMIGKYVDYLIRFENTGTYAAENVVVKDIIDTKRFDVSTLQITDASHEVYTRIEGNKVEFIFENIQLPFDDANNDGYIAFKIKTLSTLQLGDSLKNLADIYFDYNFPIRTNEAQTTVALPSFTQDWVSDINVYPNPVSDILHLQTEETWTKAEIFDVSGRIMRAESLSSQSIDVSTLESGTYFVRLRNGDRVGRVKFVKM